MGYDPADFYEIIYKLQEFLGNSLNLLLHPDKIIIRNTRRGIDFLGYIILPYHRVMRAGTRRRIICKVINKRDEFESETGVVSDESFKQSLKSYLGCFSHCNGYDLENEIIWLSGLGQIEIE